MAIARLTIALGLALLASPATPPVAQARPAPQPKVEERHQNLVQGSLLVLPGDYLLVWNDHGRAQMRDPEGRWNDDLRLPFEIVSSIVSDREGFLAAGRVAGLGTGVGRMAGEHDEVVLFSAMAHELRRWTPGEVVLDLSSAQTRWVAAVSGLIELLPNGQLGERVPYLDRKPPSGGAAIYDHAGGRVVCNGGNLTMQDYAHARCRASGDESWHFESMGMEVALACGSWLVTIEGKKRQEIDVRSFSSGKFVAKRSFKDAPVVRCAGEDSLVVGERSLYALQLPSLVPRWTRVVGGSRIRDVAPLRGHVAYTIGDAREIVLIPR